MPISERRGEAVKNWFKKTLSNQNMLLLMGYQNRQKIGMLRFDLINEKALVREFSKKNF